MNSKKPLPPLRTRLLVLLSGVAASALAWQARPLLQERWALMYEKKQAGCLPWQFYWFDKKQPKPVLRRGDLILFPARGMEPVIAEGKPIGKTVAGLPGDEVRIVQGRVYINGHLLTDVSYGVAKLGKSINYWDKTYRLGKDEIFVFGSEPHSWDSRYWGPYPAALVRGRLHLLF